MLTQNPDKWFFQLSITGGHGMNHDGKHWILMNQLDNAKSFYKLYDIEFLVRTWSETNKNCYFIALFPTCREVFREFYHRNCISASSQQEAEQKFKADDEEKERKRKLAPPSTEEDLEFQKETKLELEAIIDDDQVVERIEKQVRES